MGDLIIVSVLPAMEAGEVAKVGSCLIRCDGSFLVPCSGCSVVVQGSKGGFVDIIEGGSHVHSGKDAHLFQIAVC